jgi:uncharacterized protein (DUF2147 family)
MDTTLGLANIVATHSHYQYPHGQYNEYHKVHSVVSATPLTPAPDTAMLSPVTKRNPEKQGNWFTQHRPDKLAICLCGDSQNEKRATRKKTTREDI